MGLLIEGLGRGIIDFFKWFSITALVDSVIYGFGYVVVKILTLGRYPLSNKDNQGLCIVAGLISFIIIIGCLAMYNGR
jgi:hypothetical protein